MTPSKSRQWRTHITLFVLAVIVSFVYGVVVGTYKIVPFEQLRTAKKSVANVWNVAAKKSEGKKAESNRENRREIFKIYEATSDVVMIGDSITDTVDWAELFPGISIANRGLNGDTTEEVLKRLDSVYSTGAKRAFLLIGINDFSNGVSVDTAYSNYEMIIEDLLSHGIQPIIQSTLLAGENREHFNAQVNELNSRLRKLAAIQGIFFIDLNAGLAKRGILEARFTSDDIHLNAAGYEIWKRTIEPVLRQESVSAEITEIVTNNP